MINEFLEYINSFDGFGFEGLLEDFGKMNDVKTQIITSITSFEDWGGCGCCGSTQEHHNFIIDNEEYWIIERTETYCGETTTEYELYE